MAAARSIGKDYSSGAAQTKQSERNCSKFPKKSLLRVEKHKKKKRLAVKAAFWEIKLHFQMCFNAEKP